MDFFLKFSAVVGTYRYKSPENISLNPNISGFMVLFKQWQIGVPRRTF